MKNYSQNNEQEVILNYLEKRQMTKGTLLEVGAYDHRANEILSWFGGSPR